MSATAEALHLDAATRRLLALTDAQRITCIDRDLWIGYGRARDAHNRLERILRSERRMRPDNLLIVGASNNGKTAIARRFLARHTMAEDPAAERAAIAVALIQAPNGPRIPLLLSAILQALGREPKLRCSIAQLRSETYRAMADVGLRLLLIDDLHNIRGAGVSSLLIELRNLGSVTGISLGCFATKEIAYVFRQDEQLANRFELLTLPRWQFEDAEYARLLVTFEQMIPLRHRSGLTEPVLAHNLLLAADGLIGGIANLLRQAAIEAIRTGHERIDAAKLARAQPASPERIEAVALAPDL
ncbi:TniB family NTP-binding protein [Acidiphilium iwatense]|uniref:TniB family NTP-binding protein n=1 Tax=Acidiphilium iwatense TaxID=768198 RepID=A0ABS9DSS4_9PROT|nr:TniB family NTP-binding protein [Acidiphilium iwatense]MCF3945784.1 TniB family NTP-binding protein [Acidiphilium iwatense]